MSHYPYHYHYLKYCDINHYNGDNCGNGSFSVPYHYHYLKHCDINNCNSDNSGNGSGRWYLKYCDINHYNSDNCGSGSGRCHTTRVTLPVTLPVP